MENICVENELERQFPCQTPFDDIFKYEARKDEIVYASSSDTAT